MLRPQSGTMSELSELQSMLITASLDMASGVFGVTVPAAAAPIVVHKRVVDDHGLRRARRSWPGLRQPRPFRSVVSVLRGIVFEQACC